jgi:hypothetical protein
MENMVGVFSTNVDLEEVINLAVEHGFSNINS